MGGLAGNVRKGRDERRRVGRARMGGLLSPAFAGAEGAGVVERFHQPCAVDFEVGRGWRGGLDVSKLLAMAWGRGLRSQEWAVESGEATLTCMGCKKSWKSESSGHYELGIFGLLVPLRMKKRTKMIFQETQGSDLNKESPTGILLPG